MIFNDNEKDQKRVTVNRIVNDPNVTELELGGKKIEKDKFVEFVQMQNQKGSLNPRPLIVSWDDVIQFTSIGFLDILIASSNAKLKENFDFSKFVRRSTPSNSLEAVYESIETDIPYDKFLYLYDGWYDSILNKSTLNTRSQYILSRLVGERAVDSLHILFRRECETSNAIIQKLISEFPGLPIEAHYTNRTNMTSIWTRDAGVIMHYDVGEVLETLLKKDIKNRVVIGPSYHHGVNPVMLDFILHGHAKIGITKDSPIDQLIFNTLSILFYDEFEERLLEELESEDNNVEGVNSNE